MITRISAIQREGAIGLPSLAVACAAHHSTRDIRRFAREERGLPGWLRPLAYATPLWHGVALCRSLSLGTVDAGSVAIHSAYLAALIAAGLYAGAVTYRRRLYV